MPRRLALPLACLAALLAAPRAWAERPGTYLVDPGGEVRSVRVLDVDGDGRRDVVALLVDATGHDEVLVLRTPTTPVPRRLYPDDHRVRIPCDGALGRAGAVAVGRFGPDGAVRLRFLGPDGIRDVRPDGTADAPTPRHAAASLLARSAGRRLVFWDAVADLDGDGRDEVWYPSAEGDGPMHVFGGVPASDRRLAITATNRGASGGIRRLARHAYVPNLAAADLDGDGTRELVAMRDQHLVGWSLATPAVDGLLPPSYRLHLPFLAPDPSLGPEDLRTPRVQVEDVDGDGTADLLVTLITGVRTRLASIRTILFHYPGPFRDAQTGQLVKPRARIDTQSIVLHPTFVDIDGDGDRDYVGDSIRGTMLDLIARMMGRDPEVTFVGFRFDKDGGTFERTPFFTIERSYPAKEALSNRFRRSAWFDGDFDGDGHRDLLDLGNLSGVAIAAGTPGAAGAPVSFDTALLPRVPVHEGLTAGARTADLNADGRADAVLWSATRLYVVLSKGAGR